MVSPCYGWLETDRLAIEAAIVNHTVLFAALLAAFHVRLATYFKSISSNMHSMAYR